MKSKTMLFMASPLLALGLSNCTAGTDGDKGSIPPNVLVISNRTFFAEKCSGERSRAFIIMRMCVKIPVMEISSVYILAIGCWLLACVKAIVMGV